MVPRDRAAGGQSKLACRSIDRGYGFAGQQLDFLLGIKRVRSEPQLVETAVAGEVGFGEGRALVG